MIVVHVEDYFDPTAGYQINELLFAGKDYGDEVYLITSNDMSPFHKDHSIEADKEFEIKTGVKIIRLEVYFKISSRIILKGLLETINKLNPQLVYMHGIGDFKDIILLRPKRKYIIVRDCHMSWIASQNKFRKIYYTFFRKIFAPIINKTDKYNKIFALGDEEYQYLTNLGISSRKIDYLRHGYNESIMYYDESARIKLRREYGFEETDIVISYIGKFNNSKRPDIVFDIVDNIDEEFVDKKNIRLLFIGPKENKYMEDIFIFKLNKMKEQIEVTIDSSKPFSELRKYYSASDICIFPKETSLSSIHAQVCGCPVIMEKHQSNLERIINSENLFEVDKLNQASEILQRVIKRKEYLKCNNNTTLFKDREYKNQVVKLKKIL
ncbi:glycosyltransferase [Trichococcus shcherbakoviae]|uniref:glycosyltransferase n=1 Tax=Trichococcus shcherbakoviae TaxID=2094020 RepID=UPI002AA6FE0D|nr:glycosyltransferase [Trichococcus shcherbakoviae]